MSNLAAMQAAVERSRRNLTTLELLAVRQREFFAREYERAECANGRAPDLDLQPDSYQ